MRLRFKVQPYQTEAVDAVVDCFAGQPRRIGAGAEIVLSEAELLANIRAVQRERGLPLSAALARSPAAAPGTPNLDVEMETGTGKTYVYIKTIMELNKRYGWSKFIVVVPSVAIREGVRASFEITAEHFLQAYGSRPRSHRYDSRRLHELERFSSDAGVQVLIINVQAFNAADRDSRRIYQVLDDFQSRRPIDVISATRPVVIIDEPQQIGAARSLQALSQFNPLMLLRYSATHRVEHNTVHRLGALDAYQRKLVKKIAVRGITVQGLAGAAAYLYLDAIELAKGARPRARVELEVRTAAGVRRQLKRLGQDADLYQASGGIDAYRGLRITDIDAGRDVIELSGGSLVAASVVAVGQATADVTEEARRRIQIREVIRAHLAKERELFPLGIKVLSLFFIDEVARYRDYRRADTRGEYARVFAAEYAEQVSDLLGELAANGDAAGYRAYLAAISAESTHRGYFSVDKKTGRAVDGEPGRAACERGQSADADAYDLILRDKERLLSLGEPARFIFSHSALREGWDNPNVFVMGMLKRSDSTVSRRQEIGRGLRLCVNQDGERIDDPATVHEINELTVVTDESYTEFVDGLQRELGDAPPTPLTAGRAGEAGGGSTSYPRPSDGRKRRHARQEEARGSRQAARSVAFDSGDLIARCVAALDAGLRVDQLRYVVRHGEQLPAAGSCSAGPGAGTEADTGAGGGFRATGTTSHAGAASSQVRYDLLGELAARTQLTRRTIAAIVVRVSPDTFAQYGRNPAQFISGAARLISDQLAGLIAEQGPAAHDLKG